MLSTLGKIQPIDDTQLSKLSEVLDNLNTEQKIWLSGYLAGQSITSSSISASSPINNTHAESKLTVLYGSQTGNARLVAENFFETAKSKGLHTELVSLADFKPRQITKEHNIVLLVSTHGEGDAPDDAEIFYEYLFSDKAPELKQLHYSILAFGDSSYEKYCQTGIDFDQRFEQLSAHRVFPRVDCDLDYESDAKVWQQKTLASFIEHIKPGESSNIIPISNSSASSINTYNRNNPFSAEIITSQQLTTEQSVKVVFHIELSLENSGITYHPGDTLGVYALNPPEDVDALIQHLNIKPDTAVKRNEQEISLKQLLIENAEISLLNKKFLTFYAAKTIDESLSEQINSHEKFTDFVQNHQLIDVIKKFPATITAQELVDNLPKITPRMYSIASSHQTHPEEVHLTVALVTAEQDRSGLVSGALCRWLQEGEQVKVFVEPNHNFRLPEDPNTPIIMVGPGTGIAPFRSFLQERQTSQHPGKNWLFFGNPNFDHDFLYQLEWQKLIKTDVLSRIDLAFSRDQAQKIYVQNRIQDQAVEIWQWLQDGAHFYLCGDKNQMAKSVEDCLLTIIQQQGQQSAEDAQAYLQNLKRQKRYQKDVY